MEKHTKTPLILGLGIFLLTGCSTIIDDNDTKLIEKQRLEQLSTLVAGSNYLKEYCKREDIPPTEYLAKHALALAKQKNWRLRSDALDIQKRAAEIVQELQVDGTPVSEKCGFFNRSLSTFIEQSKSI